MKWYYKCLIPLLLMLNQTAFSCPGHDHDHHHKGHGHHCHGGVFQYSTIGALLEAYLDGGMTLQRLSRKGDFGLGTYNGLNGEMVALDGKFFQIKQDGKAYPVEDTVQTPFATVIHFAADKTLKLSETLNYEELQQFLKKEANPGNRIQAIRIDGKFKNLTLRSIPKQNHPYRKLAEIIKTDMVTFEHKDIEGTLVGFWFPEYMKDLNVAGYHFHFIDKDRKLGGHVLALTSMHGTASVQTTRRFKMILPDDADFNQLDLSDVHRSDIDAVEKDPVNHNGQTTPFLGFVRLFARLLLPCRSPFA